MTDETDALAHTSRELAAATRILEWRGILNYSGHISARIPGSQDVLIQRRNDSRAKVLPERLVRVAMDGRTLSNEGKPPSELIIHLAILRARPDVRCVLHCHMPSAVKFTLMKDARLTPLLSHATRWRSGIPIHDNPGHIESEDEGRALAQTLGSHNAALMRAHGMVLVAESPQGIVVDAIHFQENADALMDVLRAGQTPLALSAAEVEGIVAHERREHHTRKIWDHYAGKATEAGVIPENWSFGKLN